MCSWKAGYECPKHQNFSYVCENRSTGSRKEILTKQGMPQGSPNFRHYGKWPCSIVPYSSTNGGNQVRTRVNSTNLGAMKTKLYWNESHLKLECLELEVQQCRNWKVYGKTKIKTFGELSGASVCSCNCSLLIHLSSSYILLCILSSSQFRRILGHKYSLITTCWHSFTKPV